MTESEREKLIELLEEGECKLTAPCNTMCDDIDSRNCFEEKLADYLLKNNIMVLSCQIGDIVYIISKYNGNPYCGVKSDKIQMIGTTSRGWHIKTRGNSK